jgi:uncharacterized membrane protein YgdD (TMEM256/DUF423 family)
MNPSLWIASGALSASLAVMIRASLSHGQEMTPRLHALMAANDMHLTHSLALVVIGIAIHVFGRKLLLAVSGALFAAGLILFSLTIYLNAGAIGLGFLTPVGGIAFITGWLVLAIWGWRDWRAGGGPG